ncbi:MAG: hypothetical protein Q7U75_01880, partial [Desulfobacterales bacterium]|nr:hypothetical protein [Desulfobacterales bacterium]
MDHFTLLTDRLAETLKFYERFGLASGPRPNFRVGGAWLYAGGHPVLHVIEVDVLPESPLGVLDHMAFWGADVVATLHSLRTAGIHYRLTRLPSPWTSWQLFFVDPNGAKVE